MVWVKRNDKVFSKVRDSKIVKKDFIIAESVAKNFSFLDKENKGNIFGRDIYAPMFQIMKVHRNYPVRISSTEMSFTKIYPLKDSNFSKKNFRFPGEIYKDKMSYDVATFMMVPYNPDDIGAWNKDNLQEGFISELGEKGDASLLYLDHGLEISEPYIVSEIMPSQVLLHLHNWLYNGKNIHTHEKSFEQKLEGRVCSPEGLNNNFYGIFRDKLEERFKTHFSFKR